MNPLLDPGPATELGAPHGQLASAITGGGLILTAHKVVEDGARALILIAPGLFRFDVRPVQDTLQVVTRALHDIPARWGTIEEPGEGDRPREELDGLSRVTWGVVIDLAPVPVTARIEMRMAADRPSRRSHFSAFAVIREGAPESFADASAEAG